MRGTVITVSLLSDNVVKLLNLADRTALDLALDFSGRAISNLDFYIFSPLTEEGAKLLHHGLRFS